jgi:hypothetical protein
LKLSAFPGTDTGGKQNGDGDAGRDDFKKNISEKKNAFSVLVNPEDYPQEA